MKTSVIIVADMGTLKAYHTRETSLVHRRKADLIKKIVYTKAHTRLHDQVTDGRGSYRGSGDARSSRKGQGEAHQMESEMLTKAVRGLAHDIEGVIVHTPADQYFLSVPKSIHNAVTSEMKKNIFGKLTNVLALDLTKDTIEDVRKRFKV
jgi:hypothetical protein